MQTFNKSHLEEILKQCRLKEYVSVSDDGVWHMNVPGWGLHPLTEDLKGHWAVSVNGNWRMTFIFEGTDAVLVDYMDYH